MWLTPWRSSASSARWASSWLARASAAAAKRVMVDWCPVRPNGRRSIIAAPPCLCLPASGLSAGGPAPGRAQQLEDAGGGQPRPVHQDTVVPEGVLHRVGPRGGPPDDPTPAHPPHAPGTDPGPELHVP